MQKSPASSISKKTLYYAILSGAHPTLPLAELRGVLESYRIDYNIIQVHDLLVIFAINQKHKLPEIANRSGMIHSIGLLLAICEAEEKDIIECFKGVDWQQAITPKTRFKVVFRRLRGYSKHLDDRSLVKKLGAIIVKEANALVDLKNPRKVVEVVATEGIAVVGLLIEENNVKKLLKRRPHLKPFYKPGALDPRLSRVFVNLSRVPEKGLYYDPFCGTGGFAVEALLMGINALCSDLDKTMTEGSLRNLAFYYHEAPSLYYEVLQADATLIPIREESIDGIGTDPPYGRSTSTKGRSIRDILRGFLNQATIVLKRGGYIAFAAPHWIETEELIKEFGLKPIERHYMRVHGSLTRIISIARKE